MNYIAPKGVQAKPLIPNYPTPSKVASMNRGNKITTQERINFDNAMNYGGKEGAAMRANAVDKGKIMVGNIPLNKSKKMKKGKKMNKKMAKKMCKKHKKMHCSTC